MFLVVRLQQLKTELLFHFLKYAQVIKATCYCTSHKTSTCSKTKLISITPLLRTNWRFTVKHKRSRETTQCRRYENINILAHPRARGQQTQPTSVSLELNQRMFNKRTKQQKTRQKEMCENIMFCGNCLHLLKVNIDVIVCDASTHRGRYCYIPILDRRWNNN